MNSGGVPVPSPRSAREVALVIALGIVLGFVGGLASYHTLFPSPVRSPQNAKVVGLDSGLLEFEYGKLAEVAKDKNLSTGLKAFDTIRGAFAAMQSQFNLTHFDFQTFELCRNATVRAAFSLTMNGWIQQNYTETCLEYVRLATPVREFINGTADINTFQALFDQLIMDLTELDNSMARDP